MLCDLCLLGERNLGGQEMVGTSTLHLYRCEVCLRTFDEFNGYRSDDPQHLNNRVNCTCVHSRAMFLEVASPTTFRYRCPACKRKGPENPMPIIW